MTQRSQSSTPGTETSLIGRLRAAMGLSNQPKRVSAPVKLVESTELLESRELLSATGGNSEVLNYNVPVPPPQANNSAAIVVITEVDVQDQTFSVAENSVAGTVVGTVVAADPDTASPLSYEITGGNTNSAFAINASTGQITVANAAALNYEVLTSFALTVTVTDSTIPETSDSATITINVLNVDEPTTITLQSSPITYTIGNAPMMIDSAATVTADPENPSASYKDARLTIGVTRPRPSNLDVIRIVGQGNGVGQIRVSATQVYYEGRAIASWRGGRGTSPDLVINFYSTATTAAVQALLRQIAFNTKTHTDPAPDRNIFFKLTNVGGQNAPVVSRVVKVTRV